MIETIPPPHQKKQASLPNTTAKDAKIFSRTCEALGAIRGDCHAIFEAVKARQAGALKWPGASLAAAMLRRHGKKLGEGCGLRGCGTRCKRKGVKTTEAQPNSHSPLASMEEWDDFSHMNVTLNRGFPRGQVSGDDLQINKNEGAVSQLRGERASACGSFIGRTIFIRLTNSRRRSGRRLLWG